MNNEIWVMSSAFDTLTLPEVLDKTKEIGAQGVDLCVFRRDGLRQDHVATHLDYEDFNLEEAKKTLELFNQHQLHISIGAFENLIGGPEAERINNQNHLLRLIRMAHLMGGTENDVTVGTFVGYNHELGVQDGGFEKNLEEYQKVFTPIIQYAEDLGVKVLYENCPMEGWQAASFPTTFNNLSGVLAARKLMYALIPSKAHGEIYDPSHDVWQHTNPSEVIRATDPERLHRIHVKATRNLQNSTRTHWGGMYPAQLVNKELAQKAGVPLCNGEWDRHNYEAMLPGFGGSDSMDWRDFVDTLKEKGFEGVFEIENEAMLSKGTGNMGANIQGFKATVMNLAPMLWNLGENGYAFDHSSFRELKETVSKDIPLKKMKDLV
ncbi:sugar phosphate isomerase/epimerase [Flammeovirgaceae bacterium SG7u.111]|nr:sugar phosphate isomerase/epimerase [Flammeovirgaceae bacterium SG7u.132]WPO38716.1 sugar phosphate isomerase/epimerase [Flammeovirgaceae bacterium SG7u.111]